MNKYVLGSSMVFAIGSLLLYKHLCKNKEETNDEIKQEDIKNNIKKIDKIILSKKKKKYDNEENKNDYDESKEQIIDELLDSIDIVDRTVTFNNSWQVIN